MRGRERFYTFFSRVPAPIKRGKEGKKPCVAVHVRVLLYQIFGYVRYFLSELFTNRGKCGN